jgi:DNA-binding beta-propeller fold protein YncE/mono/diheme cytochrome c family protein
MRKPNQPLCRSTKSTPDQREHRLPKRAVGVGLATAAAVWVGATGCTPNKSAPRRSQQAGSIGLSSDGSRLFVADQDNGGLVVVDPGAKSGNSGFVKTGDGPERVLVLGNNVFISNRFSRTVTQVDAVSHAIVRQIAVGAEPMGMDSEDGSTLFVAHASGQSVQAIDTATGNVKWTADLADEVRAVAVLPDGRLYVPGFKSGVMHVIDSRTGGVLSQFGFAQPPPLPPPSDPALVFTNAPARVPTSVEDIQVSGDGRVYLPHSQSAQALVSPTPARPAVVTAYYVRPGAAGNGPSVTPGYTTILPGGDQLLTNGVPIPTTAATPTGAFAGPKVAAIDPTGKFLYSVNFLSNNVAIVPTDTVIPADPLAAANAKASNPTAEVLMFAPVGRGPNGIALSADQKTAYVYNSFDHSISVLTGSGDTTTPLTVNTITDITPQTLTAQQQHGRQLFNDASDERITIPSTGGISCASCHPGGREDGMTWHFAEGLRNTPSLVGKRLADTAPYHWDGTFTDFGGINHVLKDRMGGGGLQAEDFSDILAYLSVERAPDNPNRAADGSLTPRQQAGKVLFENKAGCVTCHAGNAVTDNLFHDVGTNFVTIPLTVLEANPEVTGEERVPFSPNTPSLMGVFASAPYLSDGSAATLDARVRDNMAFSGKHGTTAQLSQDELNSLVAYLKVL